MPFDNLKENWWPEQPQSIPVTGSVSPVALLITLWWLPLQMTCAACAYTAKVHSGVSRAMVREMLR